MKLNQSGGNYVQNKELFSAIKANNLDRVRNALVAGANVNARQDWQTPLIVACKKGHPAIVNHLLANGANVKLADKEGWTALTRAIENYPGSFEHEENRRNIEQVIERFIELGADVNAVTSTGITPLIMTCSRSSYHYQYTANGYGFGPVAIHIVRYLVAHGAMVNNMDNERRTALYNAAECDNTAVVRYLLENGADPNIVKENGLSPLMKAVQNDNINIVRDLLTYRANPNHRLEDGSTALIKAARKNPNIMRELIARGADVNATTTDGRTALSEASNAEIVRLLINNGFLMQTYVQGPGIEPRTRHRREQLILDNDIVKEIREAERRSAVELIFRNNIVPFIPGTIARYLGGRRKTRRKFRA
jgi:ankyrin repeat protein